MGARSLISSNNECCNVLDLFHATCVRAGLTKEYPMSHIRVLICRVDDPDADQMTELAAFDLPTANITALQPETALDDLETTTHDTGNAILRRVLQAQWDTLDAQVTEQYRQRFSPRRLHADGHEPVTVASRFGSLE